MEPLPPYNPNIASLANFIAGYYQGYAMYLQQDPTGTELLYMEYVALPVAIKAFNGRFLAHSMVRKVATGQYVDWLQKRKAELQNMVVKKVRPTPRAGEPARAKTGKLYLQYAAYFAKQHSRLTFSRAEKKTMQRFNISSKTLDRAREYAAQQLDLKTPPKP